MGHRCLVCRCLSPCRSAVLSQKHIVGLHSAAELAGATGDVVVTIATVSMYCFLAARCVLALGEAGNFPAAIKVTAEYFPKKDRAYATSIFNAGASIGALIAPLYHSYCWQKCLGLGNGIYRNRCDLAFIWMGFWVFMYACPVEKQTCQSGRA